MFCYVIVICNSNYLYAQFNANTINENGTTKSKFASDTSKKLNRKHEHIDNTITISYTTFASNIKKYIDTSITTFNEDKYLKYWQQNIGNYGSAVYNLKAQFAETATRQLGYSSLYAPYCFNEKNIEFFNTTKPYSEFSYQTASKKQIGGTFFHTQNFTPQNNFSIEYSKFGSPGFYKYQKNNQDHFLTTFQYQPKKNKRFSTKMFFAVNQIRQDENGGILADSLLNYSEYSLRTTIPVLFDNSLFNPTKSNVRNYYRQNNFKVQNNFTLGFKKIKDTINAKQIGFQLVHILNIQGEKQEYKDVYPVANNYTLLNTFTVQSTDSVWARQQLQTIQNEFGGQLPNIANGKILINATVGFELQRIKNTENQNNYYSNYIKANAQSNQANLKWQYNANAQFYFLGNAVGNYLLDGFANRQIKNVAIELFGSQCLHSANYNQINYVSNYYSFQNNFNKILNTKIGATINNDIKNYKISFTNNTILNYVYWDSTLHPKQFNGAISIFQIEASKKFSWKHWSIYPNILLQKATINTPINIPEVTAYATLAYTNKIFNKSMLASIGASIYYNTPFNTPNYQPIIGQYSYATNYYQNNIPRVSAFFNSKIKRFRVYLSADELLQPIFITNRILVNNYPATDWILKAGFTWVMLN